MAVYVVRYVHPDSEGWKQYLEAHTKWLLAKLREGSLLASGPLREAGEGQREALLILLAESPEALDELLATDPYAEQGLILDRRIEAWNPLFGTFQAHSDLIGTLEHAPLGALLGSLG